MLADRAVLVNDIYSPIFIGFEETSSYWSIGVGRFRILGGGGGKGGQGLKYWGAKGGQIPSRNMT